MATYYDEDPSLRIPNLDESWDRKTGKLVEDFICSNIRDIGNTVKDVDDNLILSGTYRAEELALYLNKKDETLDPIKIDISIIEPTYEYGITVMGLKVDGVSKFEGGSDSSEIVINDTNTVQLLYGVYGTATTLDEVRDLTGSVPAIISYVAVDGSVNVSVLKLLTISPKSYFSTDENDLLIVTNRLNLSEISVKDLLTNYTHQGTFSITLLPPNYESLVGLTDTLDRKVTFEKPELYYSGSTYWTSGSTVTFTLRGGTAGEYYIKGSNNNISTVSSKGELTVKLNSGLNQLFIRAVNNDNSLICSNWIAVDIINITGCTEPTIAVNNVRDLLDNNTIASFYHLTVYNPDLTNDVLVSTYLSNNYPTTTSYGDLVKSDTVPTSKYDANNIATLEYKKYIEEATGGMKYLTITSNCFSGTYKFYQYLLNAIWQLAFKTLVVDTSDSRLTYYKDANISFCFDLIVGLTNNVFTSSSLNPNLEYTDGWGEDDGKCYFQVSSLNEPVFSTPLNLGLNASIHCTLEFGFRSYNISNRSKPIMTMGHLQLWPTLLVWWDETWPDGEDTDVFKKRNAMFLEGEITHITITIHPKFYILKENNPHYPDYVMGNLYEVDLKLLNSKFNLIRVYINGCIDREFMLEDADLSTLLSSPILINPTGSDVLFYLFRVYNLHALTCELVLLNYTSFLFNKEDKLKFFNANNILENGAISFNKARKLYDTLVLVLPKGFSVPSFAWQLAGDDFGSDAKVTLFITFADEDKNSVYGGRLNNLLVDGQGSSSKKYLLWNVSNKFNKHLDSDGNKIKTKFTSFSTENFDVNTNTFRDSATSLEGYYVMPTYAELEDTSSHVTKAVGKINWASSMLTHKMGTCKLYDDSYKHIFVDKLIRGKKGVHEEPFLYFYLPTELDDVSNLDLSYVLAHNSEVKFAGFQTWGAGKGDEFESGYDKNETPGYLLLEGGENKNASVNFKVPWNALQTITDENNVTTPIIYTDLTTSADNLHIDDESIWYENLGAWDVNFGLDDDSFTEASLKSLEKFREFYDFVYKYDFSCILDVESTDSNQFSTSTALANTLLEAVSRGFDVNKVYTNYKFVVTLNQFSINGVSVTNHKPGNIYRYDDLKETWVPAGLRYTSSGWEPLNLFDIAEVPSTSGNYLAALSSLRTKFRDGIAKFIDVDDIAFHLAFIKFISGTDNRAKNTYFLIFGPIYELQEDGTYKEPDVIPDDAYKIRLIGDDMDTIFLTDNAGLQSKAYNLLEASYDSYFLQDWGDSNNAFFYMIDLIFEDKIRSNLTKIIDFAFSGNAVTNTSSYFYKQFFKIQKELPAIAFNHTALMYYEVALALILKNALYTGLSGYENNGVDPLGLSHGCCLAGETLFIIDRMEFLSGYALTRLSNQYNLVDDTGSSGDIINLLIKYVPYLDFYPNYLYGAKGDTNAPYFFKSFDTNTDPPSLRYPIATYSRSKKDLYYEELIKTPSTEINLGLYLMNMYKSLDILGLTNSSLPLLTRGTNLTVDNSQLVPNGFPATYPHFKLSLTPTSGIYPVLETLSLKHMSLPLVLDLSSYSKLSNINLQGSSNVKHVILPDSGRLTTVDLPNTITKITVYNNANLLTISCSNVIIYDDGTSRVIEDYSLLESVYIDYSKSTSFNINEFCTKLLYCPALVDITLITSKDLTLTLTEDTLSKFLFTDNCVLKGRIRVVNEDGTLCAISFATKLKLVNMFGDITNKDNALYVEYLSSEMGYITSTTEISIYRPSSLESTQSYKVASPFILNVPYGNDVVILNLANPFNPDVIGCLDITYSVDNEEIASINERTGDFTLYDVGDETEVTVTITVVTASNVLSTNVTVNVVWTPPSVGDFAYYDGTFSTGYNPDKTVVGIVYKVDPNDETSGTAHILGAEKIPDRYLGLGESIAESTGIEYDFSILTHNAVFGITENYNTIADMGTLLNTDTIDVNYDFNSCASTAINDTKLYVDHVNGILQLILATLGNSVSGCIKVENGNYSIETVANLDKLETALVNWAKTKGFVFKGSYNCIKSLLFPYFYNMYLYEPTLKDGEVLHELYRAKMWYAPSLYELSIVIYYRGYSATGENFISTKDVWSPISTTLTTPSSVSDDLRDKKTPIFSLAKARGFCGLDGGWESIANDDPDNIITCTNNGSENWGYKRIYTHIDNLYTDIAGWAYGDNYTYSSNNTSYNVWRGILHSGFPFVSFEYQKPSDI